MGLPKGPEETVDLTLIGRHGGTFPEALITETIAGIDMLADHEPGYAHLGDVYQRGWLRVTIDAAKRQPPM
jgi:hypothetical protein